MSSLLPSLLKLLLSRLPVLPPLVLKRGRRQGLQRERTDSFKMFRQMAGPSERGQIVSKCPARWQGLQRERTDSFKMFRQMAGPSERGQIVSKCSARGQARRQFQNVPLESRACRERERGQIVSKCSAR
jgi:hypothetical protein